VGSRLASFSIDASDRSYVELSMGGVDFGTALMQRRRSERTAAPAPAPAPVLVRMLPFAAPIPRALYYLDGVLIPSEIGTAIPATQIASVQVTQPAAGGSASIIRITSTDLAKTVLASANDAVSSGVATLAQAPGAEIYTTIARVVAGTDSVQPVDAIFIGRLGGGTATVDATSSRALPPAAAQLAVAKVGDSSSAATRVNGERRSASGVETIVVVDGVVWSSGNAMETLDRSSINSIEVIKGAVAAELYGAGAEAGVVVITTNR
jgi:hypothetical protein